MENKFKHTLPTKDIVLRQVDDTSEWLEENAGTYYPLVRIRETVVPLTNVTACRLDIGQSFLPQLTISINDEDFNFRETDFVEQLDVLTIFIGSANDTVNEPIKNDYLIKSVHSSAGSSEITFDCELHVPKLREAPKRVFDGTSIETLEKLAKECQLGFTTNISSSDDSMKWLQYQNNIDFMHEIAARSYIDDEASVRLFVDQFANLSVINIKSALSGTSAHKLEVNPTTGKLLEEPIDLVLTNNKLETENPAKVSSYTPLSNYGELSTTFVTSQYYKVLDYKDYTTVEENSPIELKQQLDKRSTFTALLSENAHPKFIVAPAIHANNLQLIQGTSLSLSIDWSIQSLYMFQVVPVDIYNIAKRTQKENPDSGTNLDELTDEEPTAPSNAHIKNSVLSGNCMILDMSFTYFASTRSNASKLRQAITVFKTN